MVSNEEVKAILQAAFTNAVIDVQGDGYHYTVNVIDDGFIGKRKVQRHQVVYGALSGKIQQGDLHAITINAYSCEEAKELGHG